MYLAFPAISAEVMHVVKEPTGQAVQAAIDTQGTGAFSAAANNRFRQNAYTLGTQRQYFLWLGKELDETEWRKSGQDVSGSFQR